MRKILTIALVGMLAAAATQTSSHAAQTFDGLWATSKKDCPEHDGPDSKTLIDLDNVINGKPAPLVDRYENHCRVDSKTPAGDGLVLQTTCFEFWDDYTKGAFTRAEGHDQDRRQALFALQAKERASQEAVMMGRAATPPLNGEARCQ
jgi:hypothetical protein